MGEPEIHSTPVNRSKEFSLTESAIDDSDTLSTPTSKKCNSQFDNDIMSILRTISMDIHEQKNEIKEIKSSFNEKLDEQNSRFNEQNIKFDIQNSKFDEIRDEIKQQNFDFNNHIKEINTCFDTIKEQVLESISSSCEKKIDEMNKNLKSIKFNCQ